VPIGHHVIKWQGYDCRLQRAGRAVAAAAAAQWSGGGQLAGFRPDLGRRPGAARRHEPGSWIDRRARLGALQSAADRARVRSPGPRTRRHG